MKFFSLQILNNPQIRGYKALSQDSLKAKEK